MTVTVNEEAELDRRFAEKALAEFKDDPTVHKFDELLRAQHVTFGTRSTYFYVLVKVKRLLSQPSKNLGELEEVELLHVLPDFDMGEIRTIQAKAEQTGLIRVDELMRLQKAGFRRPEDIPPKPMPKDRKRLRERAMQRMFAGEPRPIIAFSGYENY